MCYFQSRKAFNSSWKFDFSVSETTRTGTQKSALLKNFVKVNVNSNQIFFS